ncbi:glycosyltransferase family 9 protein [Paraburkholderia rhizosphaerae]|uniref:Lipopolysaccharide heptosyltransferase II n=1 Tax=Paraburkholderia rhizosphaerae TaxID=480658 RepID=A0A4R8LJC8_9BURK|nr:glycosyltransferase family 9 protein [Paraburkholderia rhizosphaerae]TDY43905.1 lipopolysaccharide heptosyltransferase II [Paraburkholderia rhizosphaerae]
MTDLSDLASPSFAHAHVAASAPLNPWGTEVKRILCVRTDNLGDVLMTTPALRALRDAVPGRHLTLLTSAAGCALAPFLPDIDDAIRYDAPWCRHRPAQAFAADLAMRTLLHERKFDAAVIFTVYSQNPLPAATLCYLAGIERRLARCRENPYALLSDWLPEREPEQGTQHEVPRQLSLVGAVGAHAADTRMRLRVTDLERAALDAELVARGIDASTPVIVVHPGASAASRRYPAERFGLACAALVHETGMQVLVTGGADEASLAHALRAAAGASSQRLIHDLTDALDFGPFAALIERARVLVSNNSGPVHIASALGTPVVDLYALTNPQHGPWQTPHRVLFRDVECRWCYRSVCPQGHHACLLGVEPRDVVDATRDLLEETRTRTAPVAASLDEPVAARALDASRPL